MKKIFIDAGHNNSGFNTGAAANGLREQDITFDVAQRLGRILDEAGFETKLSRPTIETNLGTDNNSAVNARWQMANVWGADLFISIHVNAGGGTGAETLYFRPDSLNLAKTLQDVYSTEMGLRNRRVWQRDDVGVIKMTSCPSALVETAFIDGPENPDVDALRNRRGEMAAAIAKGLYAYMGFKPAATPISAPTTTATTPPQRFNTMAEMPDWARPTIEKMINSGLLRGDGVGLDLSADMVRTFVISDRAGLFDQK